jgi:hypothetical protein
MLGAEQRKDVQAVSCVIAPSMRFAVVADDAVSWPLVRTGGGPWVSLKNPVAADTRAWLPNTSPPRVRFDRDSFLVVRGPGGRPKAVVYSAGTSRTDAPGSLTTFAAIRVGPKPCLLRFARDLAAALRAARDGKTPCVPAVKNY